MRIRANAKINLGLNVIEKRQDGYHNLQTLFYPIPLADTIDITPRQDHQITYQSVGAFVVDCAPENNLIVRVCKIFQERFNVGGVDIVLDKQVPFGAGLGGGSSDAAHTAIALNEIFDLKLNKDELKAIVSTLGADCAFFIENRPCLAEGIGDILTPTEGLDLSGYRLVLVKPDVYVSTKEAYAGITPKMPNTTIFDIFGNSENRKQGRIEIAKWKDYLFNDFEDTVFTIHPELGQIKSKLYSLGATYASMSGSGSTIFALFPKSTYLNLNSLLSNSFIFSQDL